MSKFARRGSEGPKGELPYGFLVLDGGLATELAAGGFDVSDELWSARALLDAPDEIARVHREYFEAGANVAITASYQASYEGFALRGCSVDETTVLLRRSVTLAQEARASVGRGPEGAPRPLLVAASVGPFGATRHDGSEYHGDYGLTEDELVDFHRRRFNVLAESGADLMACETIPSLLEARALLRLLAERPNVVAWVSFTCRDGETTAAGDPLVECAKLLDVAPQVVAMGANCIPPPRAASIVRTFRAVTRKPIVLYPNSGETWNASTRCWEGSGVTVGEYVESWLSAGASWVGGCCRTRPSDVRAIRGVVDALARTV
jgi:homocysteine S-methyltransferase